jgi:hypothetical protein
LIGYWWPLQLVYSPRPQLAKQTEEERWGKQSVSAQIPSTAELGGGHWDVCKTLANRETCVAAPTI